MRSRVWLLVLLAAGASAARADLTTVKSEPNLERRSERALEHALAGVERARAAYFKPDDAAYKAELEEIGESAALSYRSLQETGKPARNRPKYYKRAENRLRELQRKLTNLEQDVGFDDRPAVAELRKRISDLHDQVLNDIMTKKK